MPRIFDNIELDLHGILRKTLAQSMRGDFCVGYFNLRGWKLIDDLVDTWPGGDGSCARLLVGMQGTPLDELRHTLSVLPVEDMLDNATAKKFRRQAAEEFRLQLMLGAPNNADETGLRRLSAQLRARKVVVKLFLSYKLHAKLYLLHRADANNPITGFVGSSNLTMAGLSKQGELNVDVLEHDACDKLQRWFEDRWGDRWSIDITEDLVEVLDQSWARAEIIPPYWIYLKIAYHLSQEARAGLAEYQVPRAFEKQLFEFQSAAVRIAARLVNVRRGAVIGDVVGLGKTLVGTAIAKLFEELGQRTLIICPVNLKPMWDDYVDRYALGGARVLPISQVSELLSEEFRRYHLVIIDESHNLRNREGRRYAAIRDYIAQNDSKVVLLSATPYNKTYLDLGSQLRLFLAEDKDIGIRPENLLKAIGETEFIRKHQCSPRTLAAFEKGEHPDDWRELMRLFMVRRTRSFIQANYATTDPENGRRYLTFPDGRRSYFPTRVPRTIKFAIDDTNPSDRYAQLYAEPVVDLIDNLALPRYGLGNYINAPPSDPPTPTEQKVIANLSRAGKRLKGFVRTNLFKRLESSGSSFLQSVERHILRNYVVLHALQNNLPIPLGSQEASMLDSRINDDDQEATTARQDLFEEDAAADSVVEPVKLKTAEEFETRAAKVYDEFAGRMKRRFSWLKSSLFQKKAGRDLVTDLRVDAEKLIELLQRVGDWDPKLDTKLDALVDLLQRLHPDEKVLIFSQFADSVLYITRELRRRGIKSIVGVTGQTVDPWDAARRFSPKSNGKKIAAADDLRVLVASDVLSEGQNLQDAHVVVNWDLPWAIIRLVQRVGRVDRIGQDAETILCYTFLPADGVERIIFLRGRLKQRLKQNAEVVGTDEVFFEDDDPDHTLRELFTEKSRILDGEDDDEVDLSSYALQIWKNATKGDTALAATVADLPDVVFSAKAHVAAREAPHGVLTYIKTPEGNDALAWIGKEGTPVTESQFAILRAAACTVDTPGLPHAADHHDLVLASIKHIAETEKSVGGQLGSPRGARFRTYERLNRYVESTKGTLFENSQHVLEVKKIIDLIYRNPLRQTAVDVLNRQLKSSIGDETLAELVVTLRDEDRLTVAEADTASQEPRIICSMGLTTESR